MVEKAQNGSKKGPKKEAAGNKLTEVAMEIYEAKGIHGLDDLLVRIVDDVELMDLAIRRGAIDALRMAQHQKRTTISAQSSTRGTVLVYPRELQDKVVQGCRQLFDWPMMDGTPLRAATWEKVNSDMNRYKRSIRGNVRSYRFLDLINSRAGTGSGPADAWKEEELVKLMETARKDAMGELFRFPSK